MPGIGPPPRRARDHEYGPGKASVMRDLRDHVCPEPAMLAASRGGFSARLAVGEACMAHKPKTRGSSPENQTADAEHDRAAQPVDMEEPPRLAFPVVGIGASAGGLDAFIQFFEAMPADSGAAYVLVQHLPPDRESMVAEILSKRTQMKVQQVKDNVRLQPNQVYVIRPGHTLTIKDGRLHLSEPLDKPRHGRPVDDFFKSLAVEQRERSIVILMSGMGSNGTAGAQAVKAVGGLCIAQDPDT